MIEMEEWKSMWREQQISMNEQEGWIIPRENQNISVDVWKRIIVGGCVVSILYKGVSKGKNVCVCDIDMIYTDIRKEGYRGKNMGS